MAMVYINGLASTTDTNIGVSLLPYRVHKQAIHLTIQVARGQLSSLTLSYILFSPTRAPFQAYGNVIPLNSQPTSQNMALLKGLGVADTPFKLYGLSGVDSQPEMDVQISISGGFEMEVEVKTGTWWVTYLIVTSREVDCIPCSGNECRDECADEGS